MIDPSVVIHPTAVVHQDANIGANTKIWMGSQVREKSEIGTECIISKGVYIDSGVQIGSRVKIQNNVSVFHGVTIADGVFIGPHVCFTNDKMPRAINPDGSLKLSDDWVVTETNVQRGAAIGANSTVICGVTISEWAIVGAGSVVTKDVPSYTLVVGNPARSIARVCRCGTKYALTVELPKCKNGCMDF